jgi:hypothetical protein
MANCSVKITLCNDKFESCGDLGVNLNGILNTDLSTIDTVKEFDSVLLREMIDVKNRQTISSYPTLKLFYERYNNHALDFCNIDSSKFDYFDMDNFGSTVGDYWVDLIEQVIPATTIWGSTYEYRNTVFDQQKYKYKRNNLYFCEDPSSSFPFSAISMNSVPDVLVQELPKPLVTGETTPTTGTTTGTTDIPVGTTDIPIGQSTNVDSRLPRMVEDCLSNDYCGGVWTMQYTCSPEYLGTVTIVNPNTPPIGPTTGNTSGDTGPVLTPCEISIDDFVKTDVTTMGGSDGTATVYASGSAGQPIYSWSNGQTTQTATGLSSGTYTVTVTDSANIDCSTTYSVTIDEPTLSIGDCAYGGFVFYLDGNGGGLVCAINDITGSTSICEKWYYRGDYNSAITIQTSTAFGAGQQNTNDIVALYPTPLQSYAAGLANDHTNYDTSCGGAYSDWYLPSIEELEAMRINLSAIGDLENDFNFRVINGCDGVNYWSSTVNNGNNAVTMTSFGGPFSLIVNSKQAAVRPIRSF